MDSKEDIVMCTLYATFTHLTQSNKLTKTLEPQQWMQTVGEILEEILPNYNFLIFQVGTQFSFKQGSDAPLRDWTWILGDDCYTLVLFTDGEFTIKLNDNFKIHYGGKNLLTYVTPSKYSWFCIPRYFQDSSLRHIYCKALNLNTEREMEKAYEALKKTKKIPFSVLDVEKTLKENKPYISEEAYKIFEKDFAVKENSHLQKIEALQNVLREQNFQINDLKRATSEQHFSQKPYSTKHLYSSKYDSTDYLSKQTTNAGDLDFSQKPQDPKKHLYSSKYTDDYDDEMGFFQKLPDSTKKYVYNEGAYLGELVNRSPDSTEFYADSKTLQQRLNQQNNEIKALQNLKRFLPPKNFR